MKRILITGGTGHLGQKVVSSIISKGHKVNILSTKTPSFDKESNITYYNSNLSENIGLKKASKDADIIIHCASNPKKFQKVDIEGTQNLLKAIDTKSIKHFVYISIVGVHKSDYPYYKAKLEVENLLESSGIPYTILRTTQFHSFVVTLIESFTNETTYDKSILKIPQGLKFQSVATLEVADLLAKISLEPPKGLLPDFGGAEVLSFEKMTDYYLREHQLNWDVQTETTNDIRHQLFRSGINLCPYSALGKETWKMFLKQSIV